MTVSFSIGLNGSPAIATTATHEQRVRNVGFEPLLHYWHYRQTTWQTYWLARTVGIAHKEHSDGCM
ncbi:hypothetical protein BCR44DRAFT_1427635, partial [Catenaria anguillulae PL171]